MGTRGETKNIALSQGTYKDLDKEETYFPYQIDLRNGYFTDAGYWAKRNGYDEWRDTGVDEAIHCFIPQGNGYAITTTGRIFNLLATPLELTGANLTGNYRPTWVHFNDLTIIYYGDIIRNMKVFKEKVFFFKDRSIEVWYNRGGDIPFVRLNEWWIPKGCGADYSIVEANNTLHWFGNDGDFYKLNGVQPEVISKSYRAYFDDKLQNYKDLYGFDCRKEHCIRWFSPVDGLCIKYDYLMNKISENNTWQHGQWERLPWNSYMGLNNEQYFGDYDPTDKVYHWSKDYKDDNGDSVRLYRSLKITLTGASLVWGLAERWNLSLWKLMLWKHWLRMFY